MRIREVFFSVIVLSAGCSDSGVERQQVRFKADINHETWIPNFTSGGFFYGHHLQVWGSDSSSWNGISRRMSIWITNPRLGVNELTANGDNMILFSESDHRMGFSLSITIGKVTLTELDTLNGEVSGTFYGHFSQGGKAISITNGEFNDIALKQLFCPVEYAETSGQAEMINGKWNLIGFLDQGSETLSYPPCERPVDLSFTSNLNDGDNTVPSYRYQLMGSGPINGFFMSYEFIDDSTIITSSLLSTRAGGPRYMSDYEERLFNSLASKQLKFRIQNNILTIVYNQAGDQILFYK
ncbi:MAG: hypothetical protein ACOYXT_16820 [Bacteroidota bacterium]